MGFNYDDPAIPELRRTPLIRPGGQKVWHNVTPNRFATALPSGVQGPIRAREVRRQKNPNQVAQDPKGSPQLPAQVPPSRD